MEYLKELLSILNEMSPYLLLGLFISGILHVYMPKSIYTRFLHRKGFGSVMGAALLGVPLPLCSCGVIPTAMSLKREGASDGATVAFLVGTPQTGLDSILATYSLLGLPFAIIRPVAAFVVAIFAGVTVDKFGDKPKAKIDYTKLKYTPTYTPTTAKNEDDTCSCGCSHDNSSKSFKAALKYSFVYMMQDYGKWLIVGLFAAAAITAFVPDSLFTIFKEHYLLNILLILLISAPMYVCATGSVPIALSLIMKGLSPGAAFVLLMAGPATNIASLLILNRGIGLRKSIIYLAAIIVGAIACAFVIDFMLPQQWFHEMLPHSCCTADHHHHEACSHGPVWWQTTTSIIFITLFINSLRRQYITKK